MFVTDQYAFYVCQNVKKIYTMYTIKGVHMQHKETRINLPNEFECDYAITKYDPEPKQCVSSDVLSIKGARDLRSVSVTFM